MVQGENSVLQGGRELASINIRDSFAGSLFSRVIDSVNTLAKNAGVSAIGKTSPPPKIDSIQVSGTQNGKGVMTAPAEILHWTLTHNQAIGKGIRYFSEIDTDPNFPAPHVHDHGTSRTGFLTLPTYTSAAQKLATTPQNYYLRSFAQMPGSDASAPTVLGNLGGAIKINMSGTSVTPLLASTSSGTASPQGQQGAQGLGTNLQRAKPQAKRQLRQF